MRREEVEELIAGYRRMVATEPLPEPPLLLPGSFNPFHRGHAGLLAAAERMSGRKGALELSVMNVDKPPLSIGEVFRRLKGIGGFRPVVLTRAPTFLEKAEFFPGAWFVLGYDTAIRLLDPRYHADINGMLERFASSDTRFYVGGRFWNDRFCTLDDLPIPPPFRRLFRAIPERNFREDISSTLLRERKIRGEPEHEKGKARK